MTERSHLTLGSMNFPPICLFRNYFEICRSLNHERNLNFSIFRENLNVKSWFIWQWMKDLTLINFISKYVWYTRLINSLLVTKKHYIGLNLNLRRTLTRIIKNESRMYICISIVHNNSDQIHECTIFSIVINIIIKLSFIIDKHLVKREQRKKRGRDDFFCSRALVARFERGLWSGRKRAVRQAWKARAVHIRGLVVLTSIVARTFVRSTAASSIPPLPDITLQMHIICIIIRSTFHAVVKAATLPRTVDETRGRGRPDYQLR